MPTLSLEPEFTRSHGSLYKALARGRIDEDRLRQLLLEHRPGDWPMVFAVDASTWDRCDAECSPERGFYYSASKHSAGQPIVAGWSFQWICQLSFSPDSWTAPVDVRRITPKQDTTTATTDQIRRLVDLLPADREVPLFVFDAGYDPIAIAHDLGRHPGPAPHPDPRRSGLLCRSAAPAEKTQGHRRPAAPPWPTHEVLGTTDLGQAHRAPGDDRSSLRNRHRHRLGRPASQARRARSLGRPRLRRRS